MGVGNIPWDAFDRYAVRHGITGADEYEEFYYMIREMDAAYIEHCNKAAKAPAPKEE